MSETATPENPTKVGLKAILAQKVGMTQIYDNAGHIIPVTVLEAGPCPIIQVLSTAKHGYEAIQVSFGDVREKNMNKPHAGILKKANAPAARWMREFRVPAAQEYQVGQTITVDSFVPGDYVDVTGFSKGKGFAGVMKRHNFGGGPATHGQSDRQRAPGSSGSNTYPGRVFKGKKFPGQLGVEKTTLQHLEIVRVDPARNLLMVRGAVPGATESLLVLRQTVKRLKVRVQIAAEPKKEKAVRKDAPKAAPAKAKAGK